MLVMSKNIQIVLQTILGQMNINIKDVKVYLIKVLNKEIKQRLVKMNYKTQDLKK